MNSDEFWEGYVMVRRLRRGEKPRRRQRTTTTWTKQELKHDLRKLGRIYHDRHTHSLVRRESANRIDVTLNRARRMGLRLDDPRKQPRKINL